MQANRDQQKALLTVMISMLRATVKGTMRPACTNNALRKQSIFGVRGPWARVLRSS